MTSTDFPQARPAPCAIQSALRNLKPQLASEIERRRIMPPAFYNHTPPAPIRPDLLTQKPRLLSALKDRRP